MRARARELVEKDRWHRRNGLTDDAAGRLARALEAVYSEGLEDAGRLRDGEPPSEPNPSEPLDLRLVSRLSRDAFTTVARSIFGGLGTDPLVEEPQGYLHQRPSAPNFREERWAVVVRIQGSAKDAWPNRASSRKLVSPWQATGLVRPHRVDGHLFFTSKAFATWRAYLDANPDDVALSAPKA